MIDRYSRPEMSKIWSDQRKFEVWLEIEVLACEAMAELCQIPKKDAAEIRKQARFSIPKILEIEQRTNHDVIAFLENVAESVGPASRWIHQGLTSSDILDTTLAVQLKPSCACCAPNRPEAAAPCAQGVSGGSWPGDAAACPTLIRRTGPTRRRRRSPARGRTTAGRGSPPAPRPP